MGGKYLVVKYVVFFSLENKIWWFFNDKLKAYSDLVIFILWIIIWIIESVLSIIQIFEMVTEFFQGLIMAIECKCLSTSA